MRPLFRTRGLVSVDMRKPIRPGSCRSGLGNVIGCGEAQRIEYVRLHVVAEPRAGESGHDVRQCHVVKIVVLPMLPDLR